VYVFAERHGSHGFESSRQTNLEPGFVETKRKVARRLRVARVADGPAVMRVFGGKVDGGGGCGFVPRDAGQFGSTGASVLLKTAHTVAVLVPSVSVHVFPLGLGQRSQRSNVPSIAVAVIVTVSPAPNRDQTSAGQSSPHVCVSDPFVAVTLPLPSPFL
jgi:hypothetical protein